MLRQRVWAVLLGAPAVDAGEYMALVAAGPSRLAAAIDKDVRRTLAGDVDLAAHAPPDARTRLLNAYVHWVDAAVRRGGGAAGSTSAATGASVGVAAAPTTASAAAAAAAMTAVAAAVGAPPLATYMQGMGSLAAVFCYVFPEPVAFAALRAFVARGIPGWHADTAAALAACSLADRVLAEVDAPLRSHLAAAFGATASHAELMFFSRISSLYANRPPLAQIVVLWDAILAAGAHLVVLLAAGEAVMRREELLAAGRDAVTRFQGLAARTPNGVPAPGATLLQAAHLLAVAQSLPRRLSPALQAHLAAFAAHPGALPSHAGRSHATTVSAGLVGGGGTPGGGGGGGGVGGGVRPARHARSAGPTAVHRRQLPPSAATPSASPPSARTAAAPPAGTPAPPAPTVAELHDAYNNHFGARRRSSPAAAAGGTSLASSPPARCASLSVLFPHTSPLSATASSTTGAAAVASTTYGSHARHASAPSYAASTAVSRRKAAIAPVSPGAGAGVGAGLTHSATYASAPSAGRSPTDSLALLLDLRSALRSRAGGLRHTAMVGGSGGVEGGDDASIDGAGVGDAPLLLPALDAYTQALVAMTPSYGVAVAAAASGGVASRRSLPLPPPPGAIHAPGVRGSGGGQAAVNPVVATHVFARRGQGGGGGARPTTRSTSASGRRTPGYAATSAATLAAVARARAGQATPAATVPAGAVTARTAAVPPRVVTRPGLPPNRAAPPVVARVRPLTALLSHDGVLPA